LLPKSEFLRLANSACRMQDWKRAAECFANVYKQEESPRSRGRLLWKRIECLYAAGERASASRVLHGVGLRPETPEQWCLAIRLCPSDANPQFALNTAVDALKAYPASAELVTHVLRLCEQTGRWQAARSTVEEALAAATSDHQYAVALRLMCAIALHLRDLTLAQSAAHAILENIRRIPPRHDYLRLFAATVLGCCRSLRPGDASCLLQGVRNKELSARIHIVAAWAAAGAGDWGRVAKLLETLEQLGAGLPTGSTWKKATASLYQYLSDWRVAARLGLPSLALDQLRRCLGEGQSPTTSLHAFALANLSLAQRKLSQGSLDAADASLCESLGAWAALLQNNVAIGHFTKMRWNCYGSKRRAPAANEVREQLDAFLTSVMQRHPDPERLKLLWELEKRTTARVAQFGGLRGDHGCIIDGGPRLAQALGLHRAVRVIADDEIRLLFSPLGTVAALLYQHQFEAAAKKLASLGELAEQQGGRREDFQELLVKCHLLGSRELVIQAPVDIRLLRRTWEGALDAARVIGTEGVVRKSICDMALGRAAVLFERRTREQRQADSDKRTLVVRRQEALDLQGLAWELTKEPKAQLALSDYLNRDAVDLFRKKSFDGSAERLFAALTVKPHSPTVANNLVVVLRSKRRSQLEQDLFDTAGSSLVEAMIRLRGLDPKSEVKEIQQGLEELETLGPVPFVERSMSAMESGDWAAAASLMTWALQVSPRNKFVQRESYTLYREFCLSVHHEDHELEASLNQLREHMPKHLLEVSLTDE
jgi:tetratricopeptide (TPR) repeat protein